MNNCHFGPWSTSISSGRNPRLSTFWRRRLTCLPAVAQSNPEMKWSSILATAAAALAIGLMPTLCRPVTSAEPAPTAPPPTPHRTEPITAAEANRPLSATTARNMPAPGVVVSNPNGEFKLPLEIEGSEGVYGELVWSKDHKSSQQVKRVLKEISEIITNERYRFIMAQDSPVQYESSWYKKWANKQYFYELTFSDASRENMVFPMRLETVASWDEYVKQYENDARQEDEKRRKAIASGHFRLLDVEVDEVHVCRQVATNRTFAVRRYNMPGPNEVWAEFYPASQAGDSPAGQQFVPRNRRWQDYLEDIRQGKWELLGMRPSNHYAYELTLDDGTKVPRYSSEPLKKPEAQDQRQRPAPASHN